MQALERTRFALVKAYLCWQTVPLQHSYYRPLLSYPTPAPEHIIPFSEGIGTIELPISFPSPFHKHPHPVTQLACRQLQAYLLTQTDWHHNFGLEPDTQQGAVIGKMFGVLVVKGAQGELGFLAAFSGKLANSNQHAFFVPPIFDSLTQGSFLNQGMTELTLINQEIKALHSLSTTECLARRAQLLEHRKNHSLGLQEKLFDQYHFLNQAGQAKSLRHLFKKSSGKNPPAGAGECAAPKLLQYAFRHGLTPVALAEFWWGLSPKSATWKHGHYYPACQEKCAPILAHMLQGLDMEQ